jgi:hypothetical protein
MSYNGSGTFQINSTGQPVVTGTVISSSAFNALTADLATGLSTAITKDGQTATTVRIPFAQGINSSLTTDTSSGSTGSIFTAGGVGIAKALYVGTNATVAGALGVTGVTTVQAGTAAAPAVTTSGDTNTGIFFPAADTIAFTEGGAESMRIDSSGNVGIGTTSPVDLLQVNRASGAGITSGISLTTAAGSAGDGSYIKWTSATTGEKVARIDGVMEGADVGSIRFNTGNGADGFSERVRIDSSGSVGIGMTAPSSKLAVLDSNSTGFAGITSINSNGNVGIGGIQFGSDATYIKAAIGLVRSAANGQGSIVFYNDSNADAANWATTDEKMRIDPNGIVTMSAYGAGAATFSAAGVISSVSDETWKIKDGVPVDPDSMLNKLEPGYWYYNDEKKDTFGIDRQLGFYAQNVNAAIGPEAAPTPEEGKPWGYYDRSVLAVTVMSLQKALETIESLTARIAALEAK